jgi:hypothetical protein
MPGSASASAAAPPSATGLAGQPATGAMAEGQRANSKPCSEAEPHFPTLPLGATGAVVTADRESPAAFGSDGGVISSTGLVGSDSE